VPDFELFEEKRRGIACPAMISIALKEHRARSQADRRLTIAAMISTTFTAAAFEAIAAMPPGSVA
jgi:hypothetical protein